MSCTKKVSKVGNFIIADARWAMRNKLQWEWGENSPTEERRV
jgi:hypothetical protein